MKSIFGISAIIAFLLGNGIYVVWSTFDNTHTDTFVMRNRPEGLGNQMFFLAAEFTYSKHFHKDLCLEKPFPKDFKVPFRLCTKNEIKKSRTKSCNFPRFSPSFFQKADCLSISRGYLQDERFFAEEKTAIKNIFQFNDPLPERLQPLVKQIKNQNSVSVHIRRGDYIRKPTLYPIMSLDYYEAGADYIHNKIQKPIHLFVFSDDTKWVKDNFKSKYPFTIIPRNSAIEDLHLMSLCQHNIIANSTFSWWAAYLNKNRNKIVIAPDQWNLIDKWWGDDIILKEWIVLPAQPILQQRGKNKI